MSDAANKAGALIATWYECCSPDGLVSRSHSEYVEGGTLTEMIQGKLVAERIAIDSYREMIEYLGTSDSTARRLMEGILAVEEEHADDLVNLLAGLEAIRRIDWH